MQQQPDAFDSVAGTQNEHMDSSQVRINYNPLPRPVMSDTSPTPVSDTSGQMTDTVVQRPTQVDVLSDTVGQKPVEDEKDVGHDPDLPPRSDRHTLTTYEAGKIFEEAECRVSERTIIRWCNKNKRGNRRLDCAFEPDERKYYISDSSVKDVIREERGKGRQSEMYNPDMSDIEEEVADTNVGHNTENDRQRPTVSDEHVGHTEKVSDTVRQEAQTQVEKEAEPQMKTVDTRLVEENTKLKIELVKFEEQARTKDEMMNFLRKEIDRRGEQNVADRGTYEKSLEWFRTQVEMKDVVIERLNTEMRGLLEAPKQPERRADTQESGGEGRMGAE